LLHLGYRIYVGQLSSWEVDFVAEKNGRTVYIQVCYMFSDESTVQREFGNLLKIENNYPKYVVTMDEFGSGDYSGVEQIHLKDFLMRQSF
jgi:predicted AAA+ superfamily ATPase